ncbi:oxalate formate antiporter [Fusarium albosuccineum]|uniref:Oxalate formate antiporter n=1 Tax=Fusarium albosuccineum TaxID=1237068 RepID=A0A8H4P5Q5_9HYPO|nr:oxalate formate antiporter [Fusarium albosuccineum]
MSTRNSEPDIHPQSAESDYVGLHRKPQATDRDQGSQIAGETDEEYPEGGREAWLVVFGSWCAMTPSMGLLNSLAVLQAWLSEHDLRGMPESTTGWIFSTYAFFLFFCGAQIGPIFDSHDIRLLIIPGTIGIVLSLIFMSFAKEFYQFFLSFSVLGGISASFLYNPALSVIGHWFMKRRGLATGLACTSGGFGGVWMPLVILYLAPRIGFACILLRKRLPPNKKAGSTVDFKALKNVNYATMTLGLVLVEFAIFIPISYICSYAIHSTWSFQDAYLLNTLLNVGAVPGRFLPGYVADRFGVVNTMTIIAFACTALAFCLWLPAHGSHAMTISFTILYGFWSGASVAFAPVCIGQVCRTEDYGKRNGSAYTLCSFGTLIGIPIAGAILGADGGSYRGLIIFAGLAYVISFAAYVVGRGLMSKWKVFARC